MATLRASLLTSTTPVVGQVSGVNVEKCIAVEKAGDVGILFVFDYDKTEKNVVWTYADTADRDIEYANLVVTSTNFKANSNAPFVTSAAAIVTDRTGVAVTSEPGLNLNAVISVSKEDTVTYLGDGSKPIYKLKFTYSAIDGLKEATWNYAASADRDTTYIEVTAEASNLQYIP